MVGVHSFKITSVCLKLKCRLAKTKKKTLVLGKLLVSWSQSLAGHMLNKCFVGIILVK